MGEREVRTIGRMSDLEALMWTLDKDPHLSSNFACLTLLDSMPDIDRLRDRLERASRLIPHLRSRVNPSVARMAPPSWTEDRSFDIVHHVRAVALPKPGSRAQLHELAATLAGDPFDRSRPLWEFVLVDGLDDGGAAMIWKLHHTISDGIGGVRMSEQFLDIERDAPPPPDLEPAAEPGPEPTFTDNAIDTVRHNVRRSADSVEHVSRAAWDATVHPSRWIRVGPDAVRMSRSLTKQLTTSTRPFSSLWTDRSLRHGFETLSVPFDQAKSAAAVLGGSLNDFFVAGVGSAVARYHAEHDAPVDFARMAMPVSTRSDRTAAGNSFAPLRLKLPLHVDPVEQFHLVHETLDTGKGDPLIGAIEGLSGLLNLLPTSVLVRVARAQAEAIDFATSNVRAAPFELFVAGAALRGTYPIGPLAGSAFNVTLMSYHGSLDMGLHVDLAAIPDPSGLRALLETCFQELIDAD
jgi:diacylglycerol O-acyltransferase